MLKTISLYYYFHHHLASSPLRRHPLPYRGHPPPHKHTSQVKAEGGGSWNSQMRPLIEGVRWHPSHAHSLLTMPLPAPGQQGSFCLEWSHPRQGTLWGGVGRGAPGPGPPVPGQGSASPHYLLLQNLLHPSTPNRDYRPSTVSNCSDSWIRPDPVPTPQSLATPTSACFSGSWEAGVAGVGDQGTRWPEGRCPPPVGGLQNSEGKPVSDGEGPGLPLSPS